MIFLGSVGIVFIVFAPWIIGLFTQDPAVVPLAVDCLRIFSCGNIAFAYGMVLMQAFNGAGDTLTPTYVNLFGFWILEIPLAWWLAMHTFMRVNGVFVVGGSRPMRSLCLSAWCSFARAAGRSNGYERQ